MPNNGHRFIIIEKDLFVARDMSQGLIAAYAQCEVLHLRHENEVPTNLRSSDVIVTKMTMEQIDRSGLDVSARATGATIVVRMGDDSNDAIERRGWLSLPSPFTWDDINVMLNSLDPQAPRKTA